MRTLRKLVLILALVSCLVPPAPLREEKLVETIEVTKSFAEFMQPEEKKVEPEYVDITLTRFYPTDGTSDSCMATMCTSKLQINEKGWYTYQGKVVLGAATYACQARCKNRDKYGPLPEDFRIYNFYDEVKFVLEGIEYTGIVLDSCGACMYHINGEKLQRYDIFTASGKASSSLIADKNIGKTSAKLLVESPNS
jgi:hypothetical protein